MVHAAQSKYDPPVVMDWFLQGLLNILGNAAAQVGASALPPNFVLPATVNEDSLKTAILTSLPPCPALIGGTFGLECTEAQFGNVMSASAVQAHHTWWRFQEAEANAAGGTICPIGQIWVPVPDPIPCLAQVSCYQCRQELWRCGT